MFTLRDLTLSVFAIVKESDSQAEGQPIIAHGFIQFLNIGNGVAIAQKLSDELVASNELEGLQEKAVQLAHEFMNDELAD